MTRIIQTPYNLQLLKNDGFAWKCLQLAVIVLGHESQLVGNLVLLRFSISSSIVLFKSAVTGRSARVQLIACSSSCSLDWPNNYVANSVPCRVYSWATHLIPAAFWRICAVPTLDASIHRARAVFRLVYCNAQIINHRFSKAKCCHSLT